MKSEKLWISSTIRRNDDVNEILREFSEKTGISGEDMLYLSLLTEETTGMANQLLKDFEGEIWLEARKGRTDIILEAEIHGSRDAEPVHMSSPQGFMAKIAEMLNCSYVFENLEDMPESMIRLLPDFVSYGSVKGEPVPKWAGRWSLNVCRSNLEKQPGDPEAEAFLDELEKSIVATLSDDVTIGIEGRRVRLVITRHRS